MAAPGLELAGASTEAELTLSTTTQLVLAGVALVFGAGLGILLAARVYLQRKARPIEPEILAHAWYYDEAITAFAGGPGRRPSTASPPSMPP